ncbi:short-chain collagen C4-like [Dysidea avara]|uniref:short-chain collagen C4-like n=1 Tax=Dysidea avara TaxID=196820 RepID=UPI003329DD54
MNVKIFALLIFTIIFLTDAVEGTDEDINSPLVSYLLAKLQQLESKIMVRPNIRTTRQTTQKPTKTPVVADNKQCNCQSGVVTYVRWGNSTCPYGADTIYSGVVAGSFYTNEGAAVDPLCLPPNPQYLKSQPGYQGHARLYGAEYETYTPSPLDHSVQRNVPCSLCQAYGRTNKIMIPSRYECPPGWNTEYYGYLMAGHYSHKAATQYTCVDKSLSQIPGSGGDTNGYLFFTVEAYCGHFIPCSDKELTCVVCTK